MVIQEYNRNEIDRLIADMEVIGFDYNGTDVKGYLMFDNMNGEDTLLFWGWDDVENYLEKGRKVTPFKFELESKSLKEKSLPDWQEVITQEVYNILQNNNIYAEVYDDYDFRGSDDAFVLCVEINDGDWKHEHKRADGIVVDVIDNYDNMEITKIGEDVTEEDGSDTYSAIHRFHILRYPDDNGFDFDDIEQLDIKFPNKESVNRRSRKSIKESVDLSDYKFKFYKDGYKIYFKFDKETNKGLWAAQKEGEEPFEITYDQARGFEPINPTERKVQHMVKKALKMEANGYPDNNFTEDEYMNFIQDYKEKAQNILNDLDNIAQKELEINNHGDYNSILTAEDEEDLFKRDALLSALKNLDYICDLIKRR